MSPRQIAFIFGGRSVEHEVSVITAHQAMAALPADCGTPLPVYIAKNGRWYTGDALRTLERFADVEALLRDATPVSPVVDGGGGVLRPLEERRRLFGGAQESVLRFDIAMPMMHGRYGEDGTLQGLLEMMGVAYTGSDVAASSLAMHKQRTKQVLRAAGVPVLDDIALRRDQFDDPAAAVAAVEAAFTYPVFVKPMSLGSSIGVSRVTSGAELRDALELAFTYDDQVLAEPSQEEIVEINCAVLGDDSGARPSVCEQPTKRGLLTYADKYRSKGGGKSQGMKGAQRLIPAPIDGGLTRSIQETAVTAFRAIGAAGVMRADFLVDPHSATFHLNEVNPLPGSLSFYLWEPAGVSFDALLRELVAIAERRHRRRAATTDAFAFWVLAPPSLGSKSAG